MWKKLTKEQKQQLLGICTKEVPMYVSHKKQTDNSNSASSTVPQSNYTAAQVSTLISQLHTLMSQNQDSTPSTSSQANNTTSTESTGTATNTPSSQPTVHDFMWSTQSAGTIQSTLRTAAVTDHPGESSHCTFSPSERLLTKVATTSDKWAPVDSGADTVLMGLAFHITNYVPCNKRTDNPNSASSTVPQSNYTAAQVNNLISQTMHL